MEGEQQQRGQAGDDLEQLEVLEDALLEGDRSVRPGTARAAFAHREFRSLYLGAFASSIGTWMQNVVLGALAYDLTGSATYVGLVTAAQLGPLLLLSLVGGVLADTFDRRRCLIALSLQQAVFSLLLAAATIPEDPSRVLLVAAVLCVGIGNALYAPIFSSVIPLMVPRRDLAGAVALNSVQMNASRVIGPVIGATIYARWSPSWVFVLNAASFAFVINSLRRASLPQPPPSGGQGLHRALEGLRVVRADRKLRQVLITIFTFSFLSLPFITQMPKIAGDNLGIDPKSTGYGVLYACFGTGAVLGALAVGSIFSAHRKDRLTRIGLVCFAAVLLLFGTLRAAVPAYPVVLAVGFSYFIVITSLSTLLQADLDDRVRGKVMALWIMGFGGTVPFGGLAAGWVIEHLGMLPMFAIGSVWALALAAWADYRSDPAPTAPAAALRP